MQACEQQVWAAFWADDQVCGAQQLTCRRAQSGSGMSSEHPLWEAVLHWVTYYKRLCEVPERILAGIESANALQDGVH